MKITKTNRKTGKVDCVELTTALAESIASEISVSVEAVRRSLADGQKLAVYEFVFQMAEPEIHHKYPEG